MVRIHFRTIGHVYGLSAPVESFGVRTRSGAIRRAKSKSRLGWEWVLRGTEEELRALGCTRAWDEERDEVREFELVFTDDKRLRRQSLRCEVW